MTLALITVLITIFVFDEHIIVEVLEEPVKSIGVRGVGDPRHGKKTILLHIKQPILHTNNYYESPLGKSVMRTCAHTHTHTHTYTH